MRRLTARPPARRPSTPRSGRDRRRLAIVLLVGLSCAARGAAAAPTQTWSYLTSGNGLGFQVYDDTQHALVTFLDHPYRYVSAEANPSADGNPRRNLSFGVYFGVRGGGSAAWLNAPTSAGAAEYVDQTNIIHAPAVIGSLSADSYFFAPFDVSPAFGNVVVALLHAPGASDGFLLLNFHMGGSPVAPDVNGESVTPIPAVMGMTETGPGGGAMVYVPLSGVDHADCQDVYAKLVAGQNLGNNQSCAGTDIVPGFQRLLGIDGWWAVAIGFVENAADAPTMAAQLAAWGAGRSPATILSDARAEWATWRQPPPAGTALCDDAHRKLWAQSEAVLRMAQVREPTTSTRHNTGMILAGLPPGEWHSAWVRDGTLATVALARTGHLAEAKASLDFLMAATPVGAYASYVNNQSYRVSVDRYYGDGSEQADYSGQTTPDIELDGWGMALWAARQYVDASGDTAWLASTTPLGPTVYQTLVTGIAAPLEANLEATGVVKADSGLWEVHDANKRHFAFTTMAAARGFCDLAAIATQAGHPADATHYAALSAQVKTAFLAAFVDGSGGLGGSLEGLTSNRYYDGSTAAAFTWNLLPSFTGGSADATLTLLDQLKVASGGFKRNNDNFSSYDNNEWVLIDLLVANALRRAGHGVEADGYIQQVVDQAAANNYLVPELYNAVAADGPIGVYTGSIPMVGYGAGAYLMTMLDRSGLIEPNDCGDGLGVTLPAVTCGGAADGGVDSGALQDDGGPPQADDAATPDDDGGSSQVDGGAAQSDGGGADGDGLGCTANDQCASGICDIDGVCVPKSRSGCSCRAVGGRDGLPGTSLLLLGLALLRGLVRRRG